MDVGVIDWARRPPPRWSFLLFCICHDGKVFEVTVSSYLL